MCHLALSLFEMLDQLDPMRLTKLLRHIPELHGLINVVYTVRLLGLERFRIFTVQFDFDFHTLDSIIFESVL